MPTLFKVSHQNSACLGIAKLGDAPKFQVQYKTDPKSFGWFEERDSEWLREFRSVVRKLCKSAGHSGKFSIVEDTESGIKVERL